MSFYFGESVMLFPVFALLSLSHFTVAAPTESWTEWQLQCAHQCQLAVLQSGSRTHRQTRCHRGYGGRDSPSPPLPSPSSLPAFLPYSITPLFLLSPPDDTLFDLQND